MDLGDLELAVLHAVRTLREASSGEIHREVRRTRDVAYTSVTTTLYRLVDKDLVAVRRESEKRVFYRVKQGRAYRKVLERMARQLVDAFGGAAVSYLLENPGSIPPDELRTLTSLVERRRLREKEHG